MKKSLIIIAAFFLACLTAECIVRYLVGYPVYPVAIKARNIRADGGSENIYYPFSGYWNVEGGNLKARRNNLGLPGMDVDRSPGRRYIFVLGSSYLEALQIPPARIATSIFQQQLDHDLKPFSVLNLGANSHDASDLLVRSAFFAYMVKPSCVILVADSLYPTWLSAKPAIDRDRISGRFFSFDSSASFFIQREIRYHSAFVNMLANFSIRYIEAITGAIPVYDSIRESGELLPPRIPGILEHYRALYGERFILVSIMADDDLNHALGNLCREKEINFVYQSLRVPVNRIGGNGHLNLEGNEKLGKLLYQAFNRFYQE